MNLRKEIVEYLPKIGLMLVIFLVSYALLSYFNPPATCVNQPYNSPCTSSLYSGQITNILISAYLGVFIAYLPWLYHKVAKK